jgi:outer membrane lipoprotein-sorting protein
MQNDPRTMLKQMAQTFNLTYVGKEDLDGESVYVLDGKLKDELAAKFEEVGANQNPFAQGMGMAGDMMTSVRMKFGVKDGFVRTQEMLNESGEPWMTMKYENTKLNGSIDDSVFIYTPPPDVVVMDMSEIADQAMSEEDADAAAGVEPQ